MARKASNGNGNSRLEDALATLLNRVAETDRAQIEYQRQHLEFERRHLEFERSQEEIRRETAERFARIEAKMAEIINVLSEHGRLIERLPEAVRDRIGFEGQS